MVLPEIEGVGGESPPPAIPEYVQSLIMFFVISGELA